MDKQYEALTRLREMMGVMKKNQELRGGAALDKRMATRASTHKTWRQMKGVQLAMHEINHVGNKPFMIGLGLMMYLYSSGMGSDQAKKESKYWQRFHANNH